MPSHYNEILFRYNDLRDLYRFITVEMDFHDCEHVLRRVFTTQIDNPRQYITLYTLLKHRLLVPREPGWGLCGPGLCPTQREPPDPDRRTESCSFI